MQEAFSPLALLGDAYDGALNSLIGPLGLEEAGGAELEQGVAMTFARGGAGVHFMQAGGSCVMMQLTCWAPPRATCRTSVPGARRWASEARRCGETCARARRAGALL